MGREGASTKTAASPSDPVRVRQRLTTRAIILLIIPLSLLMLVQNAVFAPDRGALVRQDNFWVLITLAVLVAALTVPALVRRPRWAGHLVLAALVLALFPSLLHHGLAGNGWLWLYALPTVATLLVGMRGGAVWTGVGIALLWTFGAGEASAVAPPEHGATGRLFEASFVHVALYGIGVAFRWNGDIADRSTREAVARLEEEVEVRRRAEAAARAAERAKGRFLAVMSHEIRTPLNGILGVTKLLEQTRPTEEQRELLETIDDCGETLLSLIENVLDFSRAESGRLELEPEPVELRSRVDQVVAPLRVQAEARRLDLSVCVDDGLPGWVELDPHRFLQVLLNLVGNAVKFTREGRVEVVLSASRGQLRLEVRDTGPGISEADCAHIFEPFVQTESASRVPGGSGLGLAITKEIVRAMGGDLVVRSQLGVGSTFTAELPLRPAAAPNAPVPTPVHDAAARRVLVVDDNVVNRKVAARMLEGDGHVVAQAADGQQALDALSEAAFDLVLLDLQMPVLDGYETVRAIRTAEWGRALPVIGFTANVVPEDRQRAIDAGMNECLVKPVRREVLRAALARWATGATANGVTTASG